MLHESYSSFSENTPSLIQKKNRSPRKQDSDEEDERFEEPKFLETPLYSNPVSPVKKLVQRINKQPFGNSCIKSNEVVTDPYDLIEQGYGKYRQHADFLRVPETNAIMHCQIHKIKGKRNEFLMFNEYKSKNDIQKLYARFQKNEWLIYPFDSNDPYYDEDKFLFKLIVDEKNYSLWSTQCDNCSQKFRTYCISTHPNVREQLLVGQYYTTNSTGAGLNLFRGYIPYIGKDQRSSELNTTLSISTQNTYNDVEIADDSHPQRSIWCPSLLKMNSNQKPPINTLKHISLQSIDDKIIPSDSIFLHSKMPLWNSKEKCWMMNSYGRIKASSKRNFQLIQNYEKNKPIIFQMGKLRSGVYIVDYRRPLCFVQAMAIALSTNQWKSTL